MGLFFKYDSDSGMGYALTDADIDSGGELLAGGMFKIGIWGFISFALAMLVMAPFLILLFLEGFVDTFFANNLFVFALLFAGVFLLKFFGVFSSSIIVRLIFSTYVVLGVLYIFLFSFNFDTIAYSNLIVMDEILPDTAENMFLELFDKEMVISKTQDSSYCNFLREYTFSFIQYTKSVFGEFSRIDSSCFSVPFEQINLIEVFKAVGLYIAIGGYGGIITFFGYALLIICTMLIASVPYILAFGILAVLNLIIYFIRTYKIFTVDFKSIYNRSKESESQLFETAMSQTDISSEEKAQMLKTAAAAKNPDAILHYGFCLEEGNGVEKNLKLAGKCFKEAAKLGSSRAQYCLGLCYYHGDCHIRKDKVLAHAWLKKALKDPTKCMEFRKSAIFKYF